MAAPIPQMDMGSEQEQLLESGADSASASAAPRTEVASRRIRRTALGLLGFGSLLAAAACLATIRNTAARSGGNGAGPDESTDVGGLYNEEAFVPASSLQDVGVKFELPELFPSKARPECRARLERLERLHAETVKLTLDGKFDPDFPPNMTSIGSVGKCGDIAQGISEDCARYNHWETMQQVAKRYYKTFSVFKPGGVAYHDIGQGRLGTCYFLGALASIANSAPHIIEDMFVRRDLWKRGIFTTKWLIDDEETLIEVDSMIPASEDRVAHFVQPSSTGEFWPAILEKTWAKIHTSFSAVEGGYWPMPVMAITRAPVRTAYHKVGLTAHLRDILRIFHMSDVDELWHRMVEATQNNHPMGASTSGTQGRAEKYGLSGHHIYSVFRAYESTTYGKVVDIFNPWNSDKYHGTIPNPDKTDGTFTMTLAEYFDGFYATYFAEVIPGYYSTAKRIQHGQESKWSHHNFEVKSVPAGKSFFVTLNWPAHRMVKPCPMVNPDVTFQVVKADEHGQPTSQAFDGQRDGKVVNSITAEVTSGAGSYHVLTNARFSGANFVDELYLSVYAPEDVKIAEVAGIADGDRFTYAPWGGYCVAHWVNGELWMRSEAVTSTDGAKIFKTSGGRGEHLAEGKEVEVQWENGRNVKAHLLGDKSIHIDDAGHITYFHRAQPSPIPGSENWWTCKHADMFVCGDACCCDNTKWNQAEQECRPI